MLTSLYHLPSLRWMVPAGVMLGTAPSFYVVWGSWRLLTAVLPTRVYEVGDDICYSLYQRLILFFYEHCTGLRVILHGDGDRVLQKKENVIFLCNHQSTVDWIIADILAVRQGSLGHIRYILKDGLKYLPYYGFYFRQHSCIYIKRTGRFEQKKAIHQLQAVAKNKTPFWMVVFPEGTRYNPENTQAIAKSKTYAIQQGVQPFHHTLFPRAKAIQLCIEELRGQADAVYDVTVAYSNTMDMVTKARKPAPCLPEMLQGESKELHLHINRIEMKDVPEGEENIKNWLYGLYRKKEILMQRFYSPDTSVSGTFGPHGQKSGLALYHTLPTFLFWMALNIPLWGTSTGRQIYWKSAVASVVVGWVMVTIRC